MDREQLRKVIIDGIDQALGHPRIVGRQAVLILKAQRIYWQQDDGTELDKLLALLGGAS